MMMFFKSYSPWLVMGVAILFLPFVFDSSASLSLMGQMGIAIIFAIAFNMLLGQGGMLSFGHAVYFGLAGYATMHLLNRMSEDTACYFPVSLLPLFGALVGLFFGILIGYVSTRRSGTTFAMISLGFVEMATALVFVLLTFFNGEEGIQGNRVVGPEPLGISFGPDIEVYYLIGAWCFIATIAMYAITKTPFGRISNAVRDNPERSEFVGYNTQRVRWLGFALSSMFAGLAGALYAINFEHIGFEALGMEHSGEVLFMVYIGGTSHFLGPVVGAILFTFLRSTLGDISSAWIFYLGLVFLLTILFAPSGIAGLIVMHEPIWKTDIRLLRQLIVPYLSAFITLLIALTGIIAIIEMLYFITNEFSVGTLTHIYGIEMELAGFLPWAAFAIIAILGIGLCRYTFPIVHQSWDDVMTTVKRRLES